MAVLGLPSRPPQHRELLPDGIAVRSEYRGWGIVLDAGTNDAAATGLPTVRLSVILGDAGAQRLHKRYGFAAVSRNRFPLLGGPPGFSAVTGMVLILPGAATFG